MVTSGRSEGLSSMGRNGYLPVRTKMLPHRYAWSGILRVAEEETVDAIVMAAGAGRARPAEAMSRTAEEVMRRAGCEVIVSKVPR